MLEDSLLVDEAFMDDLNVSMKRSTAPLDEGWYGETRMCLHHFVSENFETRLQQMWDRYQSPLALVGQKWKIAYELPQLSVGL